MNNIIDDDDGDDDLPISKSQRKRDMQALQTLGESLLALPSQELKRLQLPENLEVAIIDGKSIKQHGARQRHLQFIGKIMRQLDSVDLLVKIDNAIQHAAHSRLANPTTEKCLTWSKRYLYDADDCFNELIAAFPGLDRQRVLQFSRQAKKEISKGKPPHAERGLYQYLLELEQNK